MGNETIRWYPEEGWLEVKLPRALSYRANRPHGRYRLSAPVRFSYRGDDVAAQAATGAVRYDVHFCCKKRRWYLDASWKTAPGPSRSLTELRQHPVLAVDVNAGHLAAVVVDRFGNPVGVPVTVALELTGYPASTRGGRLRAALSRLLGLAEAAGCSAVVIENLNFEAARTEGKDHRGRRPARGRRGRSQ